MRDIEEGNVRRSKKQKEVASENVLVYLLSAGAVFFTLMYAFPALIGLFASKNMRRENAFEDNDTDDIFARRTASATSSNLQIVGASTPLLNSKISILMQDPATGNALTVYSAYSPATRSNLILGQLHNRLNQNLNNPYFVSQYASGDNNPILTADANGYACFWNTANDQTATGNPGIKYALISPQGNLTYPNQVELPVTALPYGTKSQITAAAGANPGSFSAILQLVQANGAISGNDYQLEYRAFQNSAWQGYESQFTMPSYYQASALPAATQGYNYIYYANPCLVRVGSTEIVLQLFVNVNPGTGTPNPPASGLFNEIRYIANPSTATNAQGTSLTSAYFPVASATSLFSSVNAKVLSDNSVFVTYLKSTTSTVGAPCNIYWQRFTLSGNILTAVGTPQQMKASNGTPFLVYDTSGPQLSTTPYGVALSVSSRHVDGVTDQAYLLGFNTNGTMRYNATRANPYPQQYPETSPTLAVDNQNTILTRWVSNPPSGPVVLGVSRTAGMEPIIPLNPAYTQDQQTNFNLASSLPLNLPLGDNTVLTISIPANLGTLFVASPLPNNITGSPIVANTNIATVGNTTTLTISAVPGTPLSLMDANTVAATASFVPTQYSRAQVPVTFTGSADQYSFGTTYTLANIPVNYDPTVTQANITAIQGQVEVVNSAMLDFFDVQDNVNGKFVISNAQHCAFIQVSDTSIPLFNPGALSAYPGTVVTSFTKQQRDAGLIRFWTDSSTTNPSFDVVDVDSLGLQSATKSVNVPLTLNPAPQVNSNLPQMVINEAGTFVFTSQYMSAAEGSTPANQLVYNVAQKNGLIFQYWNNVTNAWVNFPDPNNIQFTQAQVNTGNSVRAQQDGVSTQASFSYTVTGTYGATSGSMNANMVLNKPPVFIKFAINFETENAYQVLTASDIFVQDAGAASQISIPVVKMSACSVRWANTKAALNVDDSFTQDDINNGRVEASAQGASAVLQLSSVDQYGATSAPVDVDMTFVPVPKAQAASPWTIVGTVVGLVGFVGTIAWRLRTIRKERADRYGDSPFGFLLVHAYARQAALKNIEARKEKSGKEKEKALTIGSFTNASGRKFVESVNCISKQLEGFGVAFDVLGEDKQPLLATALAMYLISDDAKQKKYIVTEKTSPPRSEDAGCLESCGERADECMTKTHNKVWTTRELNNTEVKLHAYEIAKVVKEDYYTNLLKAHASKLKTTSSANLGNGKKVEMATLHDNNSGSGSSNGSAEFKWG